MVLTGEGGKELGTPNVLVLPPTLLQQRTVVSMSDDQFTNTYSAKGKDFSWPLLRKADMGGLEADIYCLCPIPAFLVYDGFTCDLNAAEVLERLSSLPANADYDVLYDHAKHFLQACLLGSNTNDGKPFVEPTCFSSLHRLMQKS